MGRAGQGRAAGVAQDRWAMEASESREGLGALDTPGTAKGPKLIVCLPHAFPMTFY